MPGIHTIFRNIRSTPLREADFSFVLLQENFTIRILDQDAEFCTAISFHDEFPFQEWDDPAVSIVIEGMIYNKSDEEIRYNLKEIAEYFVQEKNYRDLVKKFVDSADGDYTVQILHKVSKNLLIFNDFLGRFSLFYYAKDGLFICSTEIKTLLHFMPKIRLGKSALAEFLMYQFPLGNKTIFEDIFLLRPSQMIVVRKEADNIRVEVTESAELDFTVSDPFRNEKDSIDNLRDVFLECIRNRVDTLKRHGYGIFADLSGGYDSRAVLGGLSRWTKDVDYFTYSYTEDESCWAERIFQKMGSPGSYHRCSFANVIDETTISSLVYMTDGLINYRTTSTSYKNLEYMKKNWPGRSAEFHGYGGEFIRHPFQIFSHSLLAGSNAGLYADMPVDLACGIVRIDPGEYKKELKSYFDSYPEKKPEDQLRRLYYEYFNRLGSGIDNRERVLFWALNPFWSLPFLRTVFTRVPLNWIGFHYFVEFMIAVDPRLIEAPLCNKGVNLKADLSIRLFDIRYRYGNGVLALLKTRMPFLLKIYNPWAEKENPDRRKDLLKRYYRYWNEVSFSPVVFNPEIIESGLFKNAEDINCVLTLLMYFKEIEERYSEKIEV
jgi:hypothetical protein